MKKIIKVKKIVLSMAIAISVIPVTIFGVTSVVSMHRASKSGYDQTLDFVISQGLNEIRDTIDSNVKVMDTLANQLDFTDHERVKEELALLTEHDDTLFGVYYGDGVTGAYLFPFEYELPEGYDVREAQWYNRVLDSGLDMYYVPVYEDAITGELVVSIYRPVEKEGEIIGVLTVDISLTKLADNLSALKYLKTGELIVTEADGTVIANGDKSLIGTTEPTEYEIWDKVSNEKEGKINYTYNGVKYEGSFSTFEDLGWKLIFKTESSEIRQNEINQLITLGGLSILIIVTAGIISFLTAKKTSGIMNILNDKLEMSSKGDFSEDLMFNSNIEELVLIENGFNNMKKNLGVIMKNVSDSADIVDETVIESSKASKEIRKSIEQVSSIMEQLSGGNTYAAIGVEEIIDKMLSLSDAMNEIKGTTNEVSQMAKNANILSDKGVELVELVINSSSETKYSTEEVKEVVQKVSESISKIQDINKTISNITNQTNLLALNAAIEAARAGEAGRGFAIVSDEIRKLSEETAASANEINDILYEIDKNSKLAVTKVNKTSNVVDNQQKSVSESREILMEILSEFETLGKNVTNITSNITEVNEMKEDVVKQVENLSTLLEETAASSEEITSTVLEISSSTEKFTNEFDNLGEKSALLNEQVDKFKFK